MSPARIPLFLALAAVGTIAQSTVSIFIPGNVDGQPKFNADILGVGSDGRTTYALQAPAEFTGTATLVEGSDYVSIGLPQADETTTVVYDVACTISASTAVCSGGADGEFATESDALTTMPVINFPVQIGAGAAASTTPGASAAPTTPGASAAPTPSASGSNSASASAPASGVSTVKQSQSSGASVSASSSASAPNTSSTTSGVSRGWDVSTYTALVASLFVGSLFVL